MNTYTFWYMCPYCGHIHDFRTRALYMDFAQMKFARWWAETEGITDIHVQLPLAMIVEVRSDE
jgi:hypothetical protein